MQASDLVVYGLQTGQKLGDPKIAEGADAGRIALEKRQMEGHVGSGRVAQAAGP
jgi:hypothetical protein